MEQGTEEWFSARKGRVTGSNVGAILGLNPWRTADDVLRQMVREYHGAPRDFTGNAATEYGSFHEDGAIAEFTMEHGLKVEPCGFFVHPEHDWLGASPDGLIGEDGVFEVKAPYSKRYSSEFNPLDEQPHYAAQVQIEMACAQRTLCHFYQWSPKGTKLEEVKIDHSFLEWAIPELKSFYDRFLSEIDNKEHLEPKRKKIDSMMAEKLVQEYDELTDTVERSTQRKKEILEALVALAKGRDSDVCGKKLTRVHRKGSISYAKLVKDHCPNVDLAPYTGKPSEYWKLS